MSTKVIMPRLAAQMEEGTVTTWLVAEGEFVEKGAPLFHVDSEKANVEVEAPASGVLRAVSVPAGSTVPCGTPLAFIAAPDEVLQPSVAPAPSGGNGAGAPVASAVPPSQAPVAPQTTPEQRAPNRVTPAARRVARELGVDVEHLSGTGPGGRIVEEDVRAYASAQAGARPATAPAVASLPPARAEPATPATEAALAPSAGIAGEMLPLSRMRRVTGERMVESVRTAPHFALTVDVDMAECARLRERWHHPDRSDAGPISYTALIARAVARGLVRHPMANASFQDGQLRLLKEVNLGIAMAVKEGLIVPVIRNADRKGLPELADALEGLRRRGEAMAFRAEDLSGGTFTISNLGMYGIDQFAAIINPPEAAILAVGQVAKRPVVVGDEIVPRPVMTLTLSVDHRVLDGATAAEFLHDLKQTLENPYLLL